MAASGDVRGGGGGRFRIVGSSLWVVVESMMVATGAADPMAIIFSDGRGSDRFLLRTGARVSRIFFFGIFIFFSKNILVRSLHVPASENHGRLRMFARKFFFRVVVMLTCENPNFHRHLLLSGYYICLRKIILNVWKRFLRSVY